MIQKSILKNFNINLKENDTNYNKVFINTIYKAFTGRNNFLILFSDKINFI